MAHTHSEACRDSGCQCAGRLPRSSPGFPAAPSRPTAHELPCGRRSLSSPLQRQVYGLLQPRAGGFRHWRWVSWSLVLLIVLNVVAVVLETWEPVRARLGGFLYGFEIFSIAVFTVEYLLRVWSCTADPRYRAPVKGRIRYIFSPMAIIDLLSILPFYLPLGPRVDLRILRTFRLFRMLRLIKLGRYMSALRLIMRVLRAKQAELVATFFVLTVMLIISAALMYVAEGRAQPDRFSNILDSLWWTLVIVTKGMAEHPGDDLRDVSKTFIRHKIRRVLVVDETNKPLGIISLGDLAAGYHNPFRVADTLTEVSSPVHHPAPQ